MHPQEWWWLAEAHQEKADIQTRQSGKLTKTEALEMQDDLKRLRVAEGYPAE